MDFLYDSNIVVTISFLLFFGLLAYVGVHKFLFGALDARAERIRDELAEARRLREEAQATFAEFERKQKDVAAQAEDIVAHAREEAQEAAEKAKADVKASIARRLKAADEQIAMAEADAVKEVRDRAVSVAIAAAGEILTARLSDDRASGMIDESIDAVSTRMH